MDGTTRCEVPWQRFPKPNSINLKRIKEVRQSIAFANSINKSIWDDAELNEFSPQKKKINKSLSEFASKIQEIWS